jgi:hypothetical protein
MNINVINIERRKDRKDSLIDHLYDMKCNYTFWEGVDDRTVMAYKNISASHKMIVRDAKEKGLDFVLIAEDDFRFSSPESFNYFIKNIPPVFHLYFGMVYSATIQYDRITNGFSGLTFYLIHSSFFDVFLSAPDNRHLDMWLGEYCYKYDYYCCDPFVISAESGYSDNFKRQWVFNEDKLPRNLLR